MVLEMAHQSQKVATRWCNLIITTKWREITNLEINSSSSQLISLELVGSSTPNSWTLINSSSPPQLKLLELIHSSSQPQLNLLELINSSSSPPQFKLLELIHSSSPPQLNLLELIHSSSPSQLNLLELFGSINPPQLKLLELIHSSSPTKLNLLELIHSSSPTKLNLLELFGSSRTYHNSPTRMTLIEGGVGDGGVGILIKMVNMADRITHNSFTMVNSIRTQPVSFKMVSSIKPIIMEKIIRIITAK